MATTRSRKRSRSRPRHLLHKPRGVIHPRVQKVGPEHFGIVSVDCAKARSKWMLGDFYGKVLVPPTIVEHDRAGLSAAVIQVRQAVEKNGVRDLLVAVERTGRYHRPVQRAFAAAGFEVRIVHPFATKQFRQPSDPGYKTDDADLAAIHRAAVNGFALIETTLDETARTLQLLIRHRRDLVFKTSLVCCQIREHLEAAFPGYAACFDNLWESACAWCLVQKFASPQQIAAAGLAGLCHSLDKASVRYHRPTVQRVLEWAVSAAVPDVAAAQHRLIALALNDDRTRKTQEILGLERHLAARLVRTPYILLLSFPGINVVSAFHRDHESSAADMLRDLEGAVAQVPRKEYPAEAAPLHEELLKIDAGRRRGPQLLASILPIVLARLGVGAIQSTASGEQYPH